MKKMTLLFVLVSLFIIPSLLMAQDSETIPEGAVQVFRPEIIERFPHDPDAFTQGLLLHEGVFYESTGRYGQSTLRQVALESGEVLAARDVSPAFFAEGLALVNDRLIQITWREHVAFVYDFETFDIIDSFAYDGEGWGLCYDGEVLYMSDGSEMITLRDPDTFEPLETFPVTFQGRPVERINELECVDDVLYANVWQTDAIVRIDKATGEVTGLIDASNILTAEDVVGVDRIDVLNGIAYNPESETFFITGKLWPVMFEVEFVEVGFIPPPDAPDEEG